MRRNQITIGESYAVCIQSYGPRTIRPGYGGLVQATIVASDSRSYYTLRGRQVNYYLFHVVTSTDRSVWLESRYIICPWQEHWNIVCVDEKRRARANQRRLDAQNATDMVRDNLRRVMMPTMIESIARNRDTSLVRIDLGLHDARTLIAHLQNHPLNPQTEVTGLESIVGIENMQITTDTERES